MRRLVPLAALAATACITPVGQKVTVLLDTRTVSCQSVEGQPATAVFQTTQTSDFYQAEFLNPDNDVVTTLASRRDGRTVTYTCPEGLDELIIRTATILQATVGADDGLGGSNTGRPSPVGND